MIDITDVLYPLFAIFWWIFPLLILVMLFKWAKYSGRVGEWTVNLVTKLRLPSSDYVRFHNVTLVTPDGTTQIDHVIVSRYGVFCIETKDMGGWIFGNERDRQWTQKIYRKSFRFQNPLRQNYKHEKALEATLSIPRKAIHSVVVFTGDATFKTEMPVNVVYIGGLTRHIKSFRTPVFSDSDVARICDAITTGRLEPTWKTHRDHVRNVKERTGS